MIPYRSASMDRLSLNGIHIQIRMGSILPCCTDIFVLKMAAGGGDFEDLARLLMKKIGIRAKIQELLYQLF
jgi:hypothetical protein